jgi:hypothetical protein
MGAMGYAAGCSPRWTPEWALVLVNELDVDSTSPSAAAFIGEGGASDVTVDYLIDQGASSPAVTVTLLAGSSTTTWTATTVTAGYHVHHLGAQPRGTKLTLTATSAMARLRWCEPFCC